MTHVLLLPFITTVWTPVVLAIINMIEATLKMFMMVMMMMMKQVIQVPNVADPHTPVKTRRICNNPRITYGKSGMAIP